MAYPGGPYRNRRPQGPPPQGQPASYSKAVQIPQGGKMHVPHRLGHGVGHTQSVAAASPPSSVVMGNVVYPQGPMVSPTYILSTGHPQTPYGPSPTALLMRPTTPPNRPQYMPQMMSQSPVGYMPGGVMMPQGAPSQYTYQHQHHQYRPVHPMPQQAQQPSLPGQQQPMQQQHGRPQPQATVAVSQASTAAPQHAPQSVPTSAASDVSPSQRSATRRRTSAIKLVDPSTGKDVTEEVLRPNERTQVPHQPSGPQSAMPAHLRSMAPAAVQYAAAAAAAPASSPPGSSKSEASAKPATANSSSAAEPATADSSSTAKPATADSSSTAKLATADSSSTAKPATADSSSTAKPATADSSSTEKPEGDSEPVDQHTPAVPAAEKKAPAADATEGKKSQDSSDDSGVSFADPAVEGATASSEPTLSSDRPDEAAAAAGESHADAAAATAPEAVAAPASAPVQRSDSPVQRPDSPVTAGAATPDAITFEERQSAASPPESPKPALRAVKAKSTKDFRHRELPDSDPLDVYKDKPSDKAKVESKKAAEAKKATEAKKPKPVQPAVEPTWEEKDDSQLVADLPQKPATTETKVAKAEPVAEAPVPVVADQPQFKTAVPNVHYDNPNMWRPENPDGEKSYSRSFLQQFKTVDTRPSNQPNIDLVLRSNNAQPLMKRSSSEGSFMPDFNPPMSTGGRGSSGGRSRGRGSGSSQGGRGSGSSQGGRGSGSSQGGRNFQLSMDTIAEPLTKGENRWLASRDRKLELPEDEKETKAVFSQIRTILNKLTPEKFDKLAKEVNKMPINTEERLRGFVDILFEKALAEPIFSQSYARMGACVSKIKVQSASGGAVTFRKILLTLCQKEFEATKDSALDTLKQKYLGDADKLAPDILKAKKAEHDMEVANLKRRSLGNIRLIGELFKLSILTESIMHDCIFKLLGAADEESLELMCGLMKTTGNTLDTPQAHGRMNQYFDKVDRIIQKGAVSSRIRFMLQDLVDLKKNKWVPRRDDAQPKTLDEVHREAQKAKTDAAAAAAAPRQCRTPDRGPSRGSRGSGHGGRANVSEDGWVTQTRQRTDPDRLKGASQRAALSHRSDDNVSLGPSGRSSWGQGSSMGVGASTPRDMERGNRYASLAPEASRSPESQGASGGNPSAGGSGGGSHMQQARRSSSQGGTSAAKHPAASRDRMRGPSASDAQRDRASALKSVSSSFKTGAPPSFERSVSTPAPLNGAGDDVADEPAMSEPEVQKKAKALTEEYLSIRDKKEAVLCITDLKSPQLLPVVVCTMINCVLEKKDEQCSAIGGLLVYIVADNVVSLQQIADGVARVLEDAPDLAYDIPRLYDLLAVILMPLVTTANMSLKPTADAAIKHLRAVGKAATMMAKLVNAIVKETGAEVAKAVWEAANLKWELLLEEGRNVAQFLADQNLQFTVDVSLAQLISKKAGQKDICAWIEVQFKDRSTEAFAKQLTTLLAKAFIEVPACGEDHKYKVLGSELETFLEKNNVGVYFDSQELQFAALLALEEVSASYEHPQRMLETLFNSFYSGSLCEDDVFYKWETMAYAGVGLHGVALNATKQFLSFLRSESDTEA